MPEISPSKWLTEASWDDVPHLSEQTKRELLESTPPYLRDARSKGIPSMGVGAIYPIAWEEVSCPPFAIPDYWPRSYALDVGWKKTAAFWGATDPETQISYGYAEHYRGLAEPVIHAQAIKARGEWISGVIDPAAAGSSQRDGKQLMNDYRDLGLHLTPADNTLHAGLDAVWMALSTGRLKFFTTLVNTEEEYRYYRRETNENTGEIYIAGYDHLMDCVRYWWMSGRAVAKVKPPKFRADAQTQHAPLDRMANY